ncbi:uncharacterized protein LOC102801487 isoform X2 [Saccoglossus kowalevskii]|uniref:Uncharacterized protein LOC102801487 n=1 Tax=Saccoglossus kowalevskii TaxID=10224 RepID=A0ABM0ME89_SACKO|nr:PREDICTED: uncharacterized protein LOC102801487 [Saccoglossus kowalevskii]
MAADCLTTCLLDCELYDSCSFEEFQQVFPRKFRDHSDVKGLYRTFRRQRKIIRETVRRNIERRYGDNMKMFDSRGKTTNLQSIDTAIEELENMEMDLQQEYDECTEETNKLKQEIDGFSAMVATNLGHFKNMAKKCDYQTLEKVVSILEETPSE